MMSLDDIIDLCYQYCILTVSDHESLSIEKRLEATEKRLERILNFYKNEWPEQIENNEQTIIEMVSKKVETYFKTQQSPSHVLDNQPLSPWLHTVESDLYYSERYHKYLKKKEKFPHQVTIQLEETNRSILERLGNPYLAEPFKRQGLVVGNVQSGKTANYLSLMNLACDYGYKLVILITGIHNNLRAQTQHRVNQGFIGYCSDTQEYVGVGGDSGERQDIQSKQPHCFTNLKEDFNSSTRTTTAVRLENSKNPVVMVIKKNHHTLDNVIKWLRNNQEGKRFIIHPTLIIDDEADNASINTSNNPNETTRINGQIREILNLFEQGAYIGYTATPFANIFIDPDDYHKAVEEDLFPRDFIFTLEPPSNYLGAAKFFLNEKGEPNYESSYIRLIDDHSEETIPFKKSKTFIIEKLPQSLFEAIYEYLTTIIIKNNRINVNKHTSMLINISHITQHQKDVKNLVSMAIEEIKRAIKFKGLQPHDQRMTNPHLKGLYEKLITHDISFDEDNFFSKLQKIIDTVQVRMINSQSADKLDYDNYPDGLNVIAIGGYSLSRGFTLEGLTVSYLIRNTATADTLLQMGRWFGYRDQYSDLCKLYLPEESFNWYAFIAQSNEELRKEFIIMEQSGLTPIQYGLKVRSSETGLLITARNKMLNAESLTLSTSYSEQSFGPNVIDLDKIEALHKSYKDLCTTITQYSPPQGLYQHDKETVAKQFKIAYDVPFETLIDFLDGYPFVDENDRKYALIQYIMERKDELSQWDVVMHKFFIDELAEPQQREFSMSQFKKNHVYINDGGGRILRPWEESWGLSLEQYQKAEALRVKSKIKQTAKFFRACRSRPLLALKLFTLNKIYKDSKGNKKSELVYQNVPAFSISFPKSVNDNNVQYTVNRVYMNQYFNADNVDEELDEEV